MKKYKNPESVLVAIYEEHSREVLLLQRRDDPTFWQSVTGTIELEETPREAAVREVFEETGIDIEKKDLELINCHKTIHYEIFPQNRHKYAPHITHGIEHWFLLPLQQKIIPQLSEHLAFQWLSVEEGAKLTKSWNNAEIFLEFIKE